MTYMVTVNPDIFFNEAYLALLAETVVYIIKQMAESEFKTKLLDQIYQTIKVTYSQEADFIDF